MDDELRLPSLNWLLDKAVLPGLSSTGRNGADTPRRPVKEEERTSQPRCDPIPSVLYCEVNYLTENVRPPHSYADLIRLAFEHYQRDKITLSQIYNYMTTHYAYYRSGKGTWRSSIRHLLSLDCRFKKVQRSADEPGKGAFWTLNDCKVSGPYRKRRATMYDKNDDDVRPHLNPAIVAYLDSLRNRAQVSRTTTDSAQTDAVQGDYSREVPTFSRNDSRTSLGLSPPESPNLTTCINDDSCQLVSVQPFSAADECAAFHDDLFFPSLEADFQLSHTLDEPHPWQEPTQLTDDFIY